MSEFLVIDSCTTFASVHFAIKKRILVILFKAHILLFTQNLLILIEIVILAYVFVF